MDDHPQQTNPTPAEIVARCREIQEQWTAAEKAKRRRQGDGRFLDGWEPPTANVADFPSDEGKTDA